MIVGFEGVEMTSKLAALLNRLQPAGVILFARNIRSTQQTWRLLRDCQKCVSTPLFRCVDMEGGTVDRFRDTLGPTPAAAEVFAAGDDHVFRRHGQIIGENCRALGFNVDFAPVLDLAFAGSRSVMGSRSVSADPKQLIAYAREFIAGLASAKVLACGKHFPGLGEGQLDSHHQLPVIGKSLTRLWTEDLLAYRTLRRQLPFVMVAHAAYPRVTKSQIPASLSKLWIADILRRRIGFHSLIVSDDLEMGGVLQSAPVGHAAVEFIAAGGDLCLVCHREEYVLQAYEGLRKRAERDQKFVKRVRESLQRVLAFKKKRAKWLRAGKPPDAAAVARLTRGLWEFGERVRLEPLSRREDRRQARR